MVAKGHQLIAFNEVTKRPHTCFDLTQATAVEDCAAIQSHTPPTFSGRSSAHRHTLSDPEEEPYTDVPHSLRVTLQPLADAEPEVVYFYADDEPTKHRWLQVLGSIVNAHNSASSSQPPLWAVYMQELLASQGKVRSASSQHLDAAALVAK